MEDFGGGELFWMDQHEHGAGGDTPGRQDGYTADERRRVARTCEMR